MAPGDTCPLPDAASDSDVITDANMTEVAADARPEARPAPTQMCTNDHHCINLSPAVQGGLVLWLDPTNLPPPQQFVPLWADQSGQGNDAIPENSELLPTATANGIVPVQVGGAGLRVPTNPSLDFGVDDFLILVVASVSNQAATSFFMKVDDPRVPASQIWLKWVFSVALNTTTVQGVVNGTVVTAGEAIPAGLPQLFVLRRVQNTIELRANGNSLGTAVIADPSVTTNGVADLYLGVLRDLGGVVNSLGAVVAVRGAIEDSDVAELESYLLLFACP